MRTVAEITADLTTVNAAIQELISGTRLTQLRLGSGEFARAYTYQEITIEALQNERASLLQELSTVQSSSSALSFRKSGVDLHVGKFPARG